jgi:hypothetical protein
MSVLIALGDESNDPVGEELLLPKQTICSVALKVLTLLQRKHRPK